MKKVSLILLFIVVALTCIGLVGCSNGAQTEEQTSEVEYEEIKLTMKNYADYLAFNVYFTDYHLIKLEETMLTNQYYYTVSVVVHITTSSVQSDCIFKGVHVTFGNRETSWTTGNSVLYPSANVDVWCNSHCSLTAVKEHVLVSAVAPYGFGTSTYINTVSGSVLVPKA